MLFSLPARPNSSSVSDMSARRRGNSTVVAEPVALHGGRARASASDLFQAMFGDGLEQQDATESMTLLSEGVLAALRCFVYGAVDEHSLQFFL